jgi:hypothetical protein
MFERGVNQSQPAAVQISSVGQAEEEKLAGWAQLDVIHRPSSIIHHQTLPHFSTWQASKTFHSLLGMQSYLVGNTTRPATSYVYKAQSRLRAGKAGKAANWNCRAGACELLWWSCCDDRVSGLVALLWAISSLSPVTPVMRFAGVGFGLLTPQAATNPSQDSTTEDSLAARQITHQGRLHELCA